MYFEEGSCSCSVIIGSGWTQNYDSSFWFRNPFGYYLLVNYKGQNAEE